MDGRAEARSVTVRHAVVVASFDAAPINMENESVGLFTRSETKLGIAKVPVSNVKELVRGWHGLPVAKPYCNPVPTFVNAVRLCISSFWPLPEVRRTLRTIFGYFGDPIRCTPRHTLTNFGGAKKVWQVCKCFRTPKKSFLDRRRTPGRVASSVPSIFHSSSF